MALIFVLAVACVNGTINELWSVFSVRQSKTSRAKFRTLALPDERAYANVVTIRFRCRSIPSPISGNTFIRLPRL